MSTTKKKKVEKKAIKTAEFVSCLSWSYFLLSTGFIIGAISLYITKIVDTKMLAVGVVQPTIAKATVDMNIVNIYSGWFPPVLTKMYKSEYIFDSKTVNEQLSNNFVFKFLNKTNVSVLHYVKEVLFSMINTNYAIINIVYGFGNLLPESLTMFLYAFITPLLMFAMLFLNIFIGFVCHIMNIPEMFKTSSDGKAWSGPNYANPSSLLSMWVYTMFMAFFSIVFTFPFIVTAFSFLSPLLVAGENHKNHEKYNYMEFFLDLISYKRQQLVWIISYIFLNCTLAFMGKSSMFGILFAICGLAFFTKIYSKYIPECALPKTSTV